MDPTDACYERLAEPFAGMLSYHLLSLLAQSNGERVEAYQQAVKGLTDFLKVRDCCYGVQPQRLPYD